MRADLSVGRDFSDNDFQRIADLHRQALPESFLASCGPRLLCLIYKGLASVQDGDTFLIKATLDGEVAGFGSGAVSLRPVLRWMVFRHPVQCLIALTPVCLRLGAWKKVFEVFRYSLRSGTKKGEEVQSETLPDLELLSIAVSENAQGKGVGKLLYQSFREQAKIMGKDGFRILVGAELSGACRFYEALGAERVGEIELHKGRKSFLYTDKV